MVMTIIMLSFLFRSLIRMLSSDPCSSFGR
jgi:hypothetical protein